MTEPAKQSTYPPWQAALGVTTGRPTDYRPEYCAKALEMGKQGKSTLAHFADEFETSKDAINRWMAKYEEFREAINRARASAERYWADKYADQALTNGKQLAQGYACFDMKNRFGWTDQREVKHTGTVTHEVNQAWRKRKQLEAQPIEVEYTEVETQAETE